MALSIPFSANSHASFFCFLILVLVYLKRATVYSADSELDKPYHVANVKSLDPNPYCIESTKNQSKRESLKVVHMHGPCYQASGRKKTSAPTLAEKMAHDQARVESLQHRIRVNSDRNSLEDSKVTLPARPGSGEYVVTLGLGNPKKDLTLAFDTGSDVTWIQCQPCISCYDQQEPIFDPSASQTYKNISCASPRCSPDLKIGCTSNTCEYEVNYGDRSMTKGLYATETLTLSTPSDVIPDFALGCGLENTGLFNSFAGLLGLGRGPPSLIMQTASKYGSYFSYCLPTSSSSGTLAFGKDGGTTNSDIKYTSLLSNSNAPSFYLIEVTGIKVAGELLPVDPSVFSSSGTIIDSGTTITRLQTEAYDNMKMRFRQLMMNYTMTEGFSLFDTCYDFSGHDTVVFPAISFVFAGNIEVLIDSLGTLVKVDQSRLRYCLAFAGNRNPRAVGIYGNLQQQTFDVVYDVAGGKLGFGRGGCS